MKAKVLGVIEVSAVFILMSYIFNYVQSIPLSAEISDPLGGFLFPGYAGKCGCGGDQFSIK